MKEELNILSHDILSDEEVNYLFNKMHDGNKEARDKLITCNVKLVYHAVKRYMNPDDDSIMVGVIGLIKAVDTYNNTANYKFSSYAYTVITNELRMYFRKNNIYRDHLNPISLYEKVNGNYDGKEMLLIDTITYKSNRNISDEDIKYAIENCNMTDTEKEIATLSFGFDGFDLTQREIANKFGISQSYTSRVIKSAYKKIASYMDLI